MRELVVPRGLGQSLAFSSNAESARHAYSPLVADLPCLSPYSPPLNRDLRGQLPLLFALQVLDYISDAMPAESAVAFGLHPNAEIGFKLREGSNFCNSLLLMQVCAAAAAHAIV